MRKNTAKQRMLDGKPAVGASAGLGSVLAVEILSRAGYDFVLVDNQHGAWDENGALLAVRSICLGPAIPMARVRQNDFCAIGRQLDLGMLGIVVPLVNSAAEARAAAYAARYPPRGGRSAGAYGTALHGADYARQIDDEVFVAVQIESQQAVDHADEILSVAGIDGCWIGPADLANSMGVDLGTAAGRKAHEAAILRVLDACRRTGKIPGIAGSADAGRWLEQGFLFVTAAGDSGLIRKGAQENIAELRGISTAPAVTAPNSP
jgi:4-hydroxy-2-oxoheptanedioate aldolase